MVYIPKKPPEKAEVLSAVRAAIAEAGGGRISKERFLASSGMRECDALRHHARWNELLREAGCKCDAKNHRIEPERLLADFGGVVRKLRRVPSWSEYKVHGEYDNSTFICHFGKWSKVPDAFRRFAARRSVWSDVVALIPSSRATATRFPRNRSMRKPGSRMGDRPICGGKLDVGGMRNAPMNETGVIFLFGVLAERLGFEVEAFQMSFPDCEAKRRVGAASAGYSGTRPEAWQHVKIEFEYDSRNFRAHGHDASRCDVIVCWVHNWKDCPKNLEVIALSEEIERMRGEPG